MAGHEQEHEKVFGIDFGSKRIGIAMTDALFIAAHPIAVIQVQNNDLTRACQQIGALAREHDVSTAVIGLPLLLDDTESPQTKATREFGELLHRETGLTIEFQDERLTSVSAEEILLQTTPTARKRAKARKAGTVDVLAAQLLLRAWMDRKLHEQQAGAEPGAGPDAADEDHAEA